MNSKSGVSVISQREITASMFIDVAKLVEHQQWIGRRRRVTPRLKLLDDLLRVDWDARQIELYVRVKVLFIFTVRERGAFTDAGWIDGTGKSANQIIERRTHIMNAVTQKDAEPYRRDIVVSPASLAKAMAH